MLYVWVLGQTKNELVGRSGKKIGNFQIHDEFEAKFVSEIDFRQAQFVYLHVKVHMCKSANSSEFAGNSFRANLPICAQSLAVKFLLSIDAILLYSILFS